MCHVQGARAILKISTTNKLNANTKFHRLNADYLHCISKYNRPVSSQLWIFQKWIPYFPSFGHRNQWYNHWDFYHTWMRCLVLRQSAQWGRMGHLWNKKTVTDEVSVFSVGMFECDWLIYQWRPRRYQMLLDSQVLDCLGRKQRQHSCHRFQLLLTYQLEFPNSRFPKRVPCFWRKCQKLTSVIPTTNLLKPLTQLKNDPNQCSASTSQPPSNSSPPGCSFSWCNLRQAKRFLMCPLLCKFNRMFELGSVVDVAPDHGNPTTPSSGALFKSVPCFSPMPITWFLISKPANCVRIHLSQICIKWNKPGKIWTITETVSSAIEPLNPPVS